MTNPLRDPPPAEVALASAPLKHVVALVNFSPVMRIGDPTGVGIAQFQEQMRGEYPNATFEQETGFQFQLGPGGEPIPPTTVTNPVWRLFDTEEDWRVSLTRESIALETLDRYDSRRDFLGRISRLLRAIKDAYEPAQVTRVGVRYVNALGEDHIAPLPSLVRPEFLAFGTAPFLDDLIRSNCLAHFAVPEGTLMAKWGVLPPNAVHEPVMMQADERRWYLDLDAWSGDHRLFDPDELVQKLEALTERIYAMFRWVSTEQLLKVCDGRR